MNYYEHHLGDYAKDTAHLSMLEHGAYRLLLDRYYATEQGIPADQAHRLARARTREEREAVDTVLSEFFVLKDGVWRNGRADEEVAKAQIKITAAQENGKKGGRPKKNPATTQQKPGGFLSGSENETQSKAHQTPDTKHHFPGATDASLSDSTSRAPAADDFAPTKAGQIGKAMKAAGIPPDQINLSDPVFMELVRQGATADEFAGIAKEAAEKQLGKPFKWVLATLQGRRAEAAQVALAPRVEQAAPTESAYERRMREQVAEAAGAFADAIAKPAPGVKAAPAPIQPEEVIHADGIARIEHDDPAGR